MDREPLTTPKTVQPSLAWATSGLMTLTGPADGPPVLPRKNYLAQLDALMQTVERHSKLWGAPVALDYGVFVERAAILGLSRRGQVSANGTCRLVDTLDGWLAVNLARPDDHDLVPAWIGAELADDSWTAISRAAAGQSAGALAGWGATLGLPVAAVDETSLQSIDKNWGLHFSRHGDPGPVSKAPLVIDLSSLWAGPLCGHLLSRMGARVIKVESTHRPDGARFGTPVFYDNLHAGQQAVAVDFKSTEGRRQLAQLIQRADVVIESARPRALQQLGIHAETVLAEKPGLTWVSITAYGRHGESANRVGFGDDAAAAAGLLAHDASGRPVFLGDAIADPIAGLVATTGTLWSLLEGGGYLVDVSLARSAAAVAVAPVMPDAHQARIMKDGASWLVDMGDKAIPVTTATAPSSINTAPCLGSDTAEIIQELCS